MRDNLTEIMLVGNEITGPYEEAEKFRKVGNLITPRGNMEID